MAEHGMAEHGMSDDEADDPGRGGPSTPPRSGAAAGAAGDPDGPRAGAADRAGAGADEPMTAEPVPVADDAPGVGLTRPLDGADDDVESGL